MKEMVFINEVTKKSMAKLRLPIALGAIVIMDRVEEHYHWERL